MYKTLTTALRALENRPASLRSRKCIPPLVAGATTFPPQFGGATKGKRLNGQARRLTSPHLEVLCRTSTGDNNPCLLQSRLRREASKCFILPSLAGEVRRSRKGGGERSEPIRRMLCISHGTESKSRNADFISIAAERQSATLGLKGRQT